jgi:transposase InsO family protein
MTCWDVTFLKARVQGHWFYLYLILDLYSRKIVGFEVHDTDQAEHAAHLVRRTALVVRPVAETVGCAIQAAKGRLAGRH